MHYVAVPFHRHEFRHVHGPWNCHLSNVVSPKVHEHDMLGSFLRVGAELLLEMSVFILRGTASSCPRNRSNMDDAVLDAAQQLGGGAENFGFVQRKEEHVRRGVDNPKPAVDVKCAGGDLDAEALGQHNLNDVAGTYEFLRDFDCAFELLAGHVRRYF
ncbi:MAG: hypothetical protein BWY06_02000 [Candidatus Latescibacteria bacterium ADurb.Bin168]|nr:MAG: hypothetical protein BWY06_02000 [Candidatus Latescibacteria bacterium ADurb.Bin168]